MQGNEKKRTMRFPGLETNNSDSFPIQWRNIDSFVHKRTDVDLIHAREGVHYLHREDVIKNNALCQEWYLWMETALPLLDKDGSFCNEEPEHPKGIKEAKKVKGTMLSIYRDLRDNGTLWNPVISFTSTDGNLYIMLGSQRICALRALGYVGKVPTRILEEDDLVSTTRNKAILSHPYTEVPTLDCKKIDTGTYNIACVLRSGGDFTWDHVKNLRNCVEKNLTLSFRFYCLTDQMPPDGYEDVANIIPLKHGWPGWWSKIELFRVFKSVFYLDLDTIVVRNINRLVSFDHIFSALYDFYLYEKQDKKEKKERIQLGSGLMAWNRDYSSVYKSFLESPKRHMTRMRGDQDFIRTQLYPIDVFQTIESDAVVSYKVHVQKEGRLPEKAKIVCFHGKPRIHEVDEPWMKL